MKNDNSREELLINNFNRILTTPDPKLTKNDIEELNKAIKEALKHVTLDASGNMVWDGTQVTLYSQCSREKQDNANTYIIETLSAIAKGTTPEGFERDPSAKAKAKEILSQITTDKTSAFSLNGSSYEAELKVGNIFPYIVDSIPFKPKCDITVPFDFDETTLTKGNENFWESLRNMEKLGMDISFFPQVADVGDKNKSDGIDVSTLQGLNIVIGKVKDAKSYDEIKDNPQLVAVVRNYHLALERSLVYATEIGDTETADAINNILDEKQYSKKNNEESFTVFKNAGGGIDKYAKLIPDLESKEEARTGVTENREIKTEKRFDNTKNTITFGGTQKWNDDGTLTVKPQGEHKANYDSRVEEVKEIQELARVVSGNANINPFADYTSFNPYQDKNPKKESAPQIKPTQTEPASKGEAAESEAPIGRVNKGKQENAKQPQHEQVPEIYIKNNLTQEKITKLEDDHRINFNKSDPNNKGLHETRNLFMEEALMAFGIGSFGIFFVPMLATTLIIDGTKSASSSIKAAKTDKENNGYSLYTSLAIESVLTNKIIPNINIDTNGDYQLPKIYINEFNIHPKAKGDNITDKDKAEEKEKAINVMVINFAENLRTQVNFIRTVSESIENNGSGQLDTKGFLKNVSTFYTSEKEKKKKNDELNSRTFANDFVDMAYSSFDIDSKTELKKSMSEYLSFQEQIQKITKDLGLKGESLLSDKDLKKNLSELGVQYEKIEDISREIYGKVISGENSTIRDAISYYINALEKPDDMDAKAFINTKKALKVKVLEYASNQAIDNFEKAFVTGFTKYKESRPNIANLTDKEIKDLADKYRNILNNEILSTGAYKGKYAGASVIAYVVKATDDTETTLALNHMKEETIKKVRSSLNQNIIQPIAQKSKKLNIEVNITQDISEALTSIKELADYKDLIEVSAETTGGTTTVNISLAEDITYEQAKELKQIFEQENIQTQLKDFSEKKKEILKEQSKVKRNKSSQTDGSPSTGMAEPDRGGNIPNSARLTLDEATIGLAGVMISGTTSNFTTTAPNTISRDKFRGA